MAAAYPRELEHEAVLRDGRRVRVRPVHPDDEERLAEFYNGLSRQTIYHRFFSAQLPPAWFHFFANVDYLRRLALVAEDGEPGHPRLLGVAGYDPTDEDGTAEVAVVVEDGLQGQGLGTLLLTDLLQAAEARGIRRFRGDVLRDNGRMLDLLARIASIEERKTERGVTQLAFVRRGSQPTRAAGRSTAARDAGYSGSAPPELKAS
jgi:RimJ/RimL family protein N-acetyltransferase